MSDQVESQGETQDRDDIEIRIYDFTQVPEGFPADYEPGFYYDIPMPKGEDDAMEVVYPHGPYPTSDAALAAANAFIDAALESFASDDGGSEDEQVEDVSVEEIGFVNEGKGVDDRDDEDETNA